STLDLGENVRPASMLAPGSMRVWAWLLYRPTMTAIEVANCFSVWPLAGFHESSGTERVASAADWSFSLISVETSTLPFASRTAPEVTSARTKLSTFWKTNVAAALAEGPPERTSLPLASLTLGTLPLMLSESGFLTSSNTPLLFLTGSVPAVQ